MSTEVATEIDKATSSTADDNESETQSSSESVVCDSSCCNGSKISQPTCGSLLKKTEKIYGTGRKRSFLASWYKSFPWLHFCHSSLKVYCFYCKAACKAHITVMSNRADPSFTISGFSNWKNALSKFRDHEYSLAHRDAVAAYLASKSSPVNIQLQRGLENDQLGHRKSLLNQITCLRYLLRQGLAVRNDHAGGSNLSVMLEQVLNEQEWLKEGRYQSPEIINEIIGIMGRNVLRSLLSDIQNQKFFSLMADETRDISNREQLVICLRWVSECYEVQEDLVSLAQLDNTSAETIYLTLKACLIQLGIAFKDCRGQAYDGAASFQGHVSGVAKRFQDDNAAAIPVHCLAHCVNLSLQEVACSVKSVKEALSFSMDVIQLIKYSPKRQVILETVKNQQELSSTAGIRTLCPTRWTVRTGALQAILNNYESLRETFEISSKGSDECARRANGVLALMDRFSTYFGVKLSVFIFSITEQMSTTLQKKDTSVQDGYYVAEVTLRALSRLRTDQRFASFFSSVKVECATRCDPPVLPRQRQLPRRIDDGAAQHTFTSIECFYRKEYFQAIDVVKADLEKRFIQKNFLIAQKIEKMLIESANGRVFMIPDEIKELYSKDIDFQKCLLHLQMLPDAIKSTPLNGIPIQQVTLISTICGV